MDKMKLHFEDASLSDVVDLNSSFAKGKLKVMYTGDNQNGSSFTQDVVTAALPSLKNIPIVANYDVEENAIGAHDVELVRDGDMVRLMNLTEPCGVVPESVKAYFSIEEDLNGIQHNYLVIEPVILWKRQEVYRHIMEDLGGRVDHSMEVNIVAFHKEKGSPIIVVDEFEFEALCLLESAMPCFEGSELEVFSAKAFKVKMDEMMAELREVFSTVNAPGAEIDISKDRKNDTEGGRVLDEKLAMVTEYGLDAEKLDFSLDDFSVEELREKFESMKEAEPEADAAATANFELAGNMRKALSDALKEKQVMKPWGLEPAYWLEDYDPDIGMVYAQCSTTWNVFGFPYSMSGDMPIIDFAAGKRMKRSFVEFDEGDTEPEIAKMFSRVEALYEETNNEWSEKFNKVSDELKALQDSTSDIEDLRAFKAKVERDIETEKRENVFSSFEDLEENDDFKALRNDCDKYSIEELEEKCYAIRGRAGVAAKYSVKEKAPKQKVPRHEEADNEPYHGLFQEFGTARD